MRLMTPLAAAALAGALVLTSCSPSQNPGPDEGGVTQADATIYVGSLYEPQNLDNTAGGGQGVTEALTGNVYEGLFRLADSGEVEPLLAAAHEVSEDGLTYTFTLQDGVTFGSGKALTADDVVYSIEKVIADDSQSARKSQLEVIDSVAAVDDQTVRVTLSERSISFLYNLSYVWIVNSAFEGNRSSEADGTGPYTLDTWTRGSALSLVRNDDYWGEAPTNGGVVFTYFSDATSLNNALLTGAVDVVTSQQSPDGLAQFEQTDDFTITDGNSTTKLLLAFNDAAAPFDDVRVRQAVSAAIDDEKLLESVWGDYGTLIGSMVPPTDPWFEDLTDLDSYDPDRAAGLLAEAGYEDGFTFTLDTPSYDPHPTAATFIQSQLAEVGITVEINSITSDEWYTKVYQNRDFEATMQEHVNDRDLVWYGNPDFYWGYDNAEVQEWVAQSELVSSEAEQTELLKLVARTTAEEAASEWLYLYPQIVVASSALSGYPVNGLNSQFFAYDIEKAA
ncbi:ABC transporter substrate-binding protein [Microbacterium excoecariae]|uniref:ABC transporter substrate-binding protein n=1 Tax=Microbacterium excoecariae TaxID=2715210 RepID=UPI00140825CE|nr:ABC transporter substrate-binding protein [Microbacterium excoecariae]NHI17433.1 ABC transporter substrate-binding protein [Microbacterium excoecariae]